MQGKENDKKPPFDNLNERLRRSLLNPENWKKKKKGVIFAAAAQTKEEQIETPKPMSHKEAVSLFENTVSSMHRVAEHPFFETNTRDHINRLLDNTSLVTDGEMAAYQRIYQQARSPGATYGPEDSPNSTLAAMCFFPIHGEQTARILMKESYLMSRESIELGRALLEFTYIDLLAEEVGHGLTRQQKPQSLKGIQKNSALLLPYETPDEVVENLQLMDRKYYSDEYPHEFGIDQVAAVREGFQNIFARIIGNNLRMYPLTADNIYLEETRSAILATIFLAMHHGKRTLQEKSKSDPRVLEEEKISEGSYSFIAGLSFLANLVSGLPDGYPREAAGLCFLKEYVIPKELLGEMPTGDTPVFLQEEIEPLQVGLTPQLMPQPTRIRNIRTLVSQLSKDSFPQFYKKLEPRQKWKFAVAQKFVRHEFDIR